MDSGHAGIAQMPDMPGHLRAPEFLRHQTKYLRFLPKVRKISEGQLDECARSTKKGRQIAGPFSCLGFAELVAVAQKAEQEHEHVDEIQIQVQRPHDRRFTQPFAVHSMCVLQISVLDLLRIIGRQPCENQHTQP